jgi:hypothetical protein
MSEISLLDSDDGGTVEIAAAPPNIEGEVKKRRGRPPGTKNKPKIEDSTIVTLENTIKGFFGLLSFLAGWFGYEQTEDLTDSEAKEGAKAFAPIFAKFPWLTPWFAYIAAPLWLLTMMSRKFAKKGQNEKPAANPPNVAPIEPRPMGPMELERGAQTPINEGAAVG